MTTPAPATTAPKPDDAEMIAAMFRAFSSIIPGALQGAPEQRHADTIARLRHFGADDADLDVISKWLSARQEGSS